MYLIDIKTSPVWKTNHQSSLIYGDLKTDIKNIRNMEIVFKEGVGFNSQKLFESVKGKIVLKTNPSIFQ